MKLISLILFGALLSNVSFANEDSLRGLDLCQKSLGIVYNNTDSAFYYANEARVLGVKINQPLIVAKSHNMTGIAFDVSSQYDSALHHYFICLDIGEKYKFENTVAGALNNIGLIYWNMSQYENAIEYFEKSIVKFEILGNQRGIGNTLNNIGLILGSQDQYEKAIKYHQEAAEIFKKIEYQYGLSAAWTNLGLAYSDLNQNDTAHFYFESSVKIKRELGDHYGLGIALNNLGVVARRDTIKLDQSITYFEQAIIESSQVNDNKRLVSSHYNLGGVYSILRKDEKAIFHYNQAIQFAGDKGYLKELHKVYHDLGNVQFRNENYKAAAEAVNMSYQIYDSVYKVDRDERIAEVEQKYENEKIAKALTEEQLKSQKLRIDNVESELKLSIRNKWIFGLGGGTLGLLFLGLFIIQRNKRKSQAEKDAVRIQERDKGLNAVIDAQENERKRIAKDLHDGIGQQLSGLKMAWGNVAAQIKSSNPEEHKNLVDLTKILDESASEVRSISHQMMPRSLQELGLVAAIEDMLEKTFRFSDMNYTFEQFKIDERFNERIEIGLYRICQELINNCIKHSKASEISVQLMKTGNSLMLLVEDNGKGIDLNVNKQGHGLTNMKSRLNTINGEINLESSPNAGLTAQIRVQLS